MKSLIITCMFFLYTITIEASHPVKVVLHDRENKIYFHLDLYEESVNVPGMEIFGPMKGYMKGNIYGTWMVTSSQINNDKTATIRLSNDLGSEIQEIRLTMKNDSTYIAEQQGGISIKKVVNKKLVKIPRILKFSPFQ